MYRIDRSLKQEGTRRRTLAGTGGQNEGMFGELTRPVAMKADAIQTEPHM
jgi:hypothetical protein